MSVQKIAKNIGASAVSKLRLLAGCLIIATALSCLAGSYAPGYALTANQAFEAALKLRAQKRYPEALSMLALAIQLDPKFEDAYVQRVDMYCAIGQAAKTLDDCNKAIALDPEAKRQANLYKYRAQAYRQLDEPEKALADANKGLATKSPCTMELYFIRGWAHKELNQFKEALEDYNFILSKSPQKDTNFLAYHSRGELHLALNQLDAAEADLAKAIALNPKYDEAIEELARVHELMGKPQKAVDDYAGLIKLNPDDYTNYFKLGKLKLKMGLYADAAAALSKSIQIEPKLSAKIYECRAEAYAKMGKAALAAKDRATADTLK